MTKDKNTRKLKIGYQGRRLFDRSREFIMTALETKAFQIKNASKQLIQLSCFFKEFMVTRIHSQYVPRLIMWEQWETRVRKLIKNIIVLCVILYLQQNL